VKPTSVSVRLWNFLFAFKIRNNKEQKLFHGHLMKMITTFSKSAYKADLGAILTLSKILLSRGATSLPDRFWELHISSSRLNFSLLQLTNL